MQLERRQAAARSGHERGWVRIGVGFGGYWGAGRGVKCARCAAGVDALGYRGGMGRGGGQVRLDHECHGWIRMGFGRVHGVRSARVARPGSVPPATGGDGEMGRWGDAGLTHRMMQSKWIL
jgi:hypothetical protein